MRPTLVARALLAALLLAPPLVFTGCELLKDFAGSMKKPTASLAGVDFKDFDMESLTLAFDMKVDNPYSVALPIGKLGYELATSGKSFVSGATDVGQTVPAEGSGNVTLPLKVRFAELVDMLGGVKPGSVLPYHAKFDIGVDAPGVGPLHLPLEKEGELPIPAPPKVSVKGLRWSKLSLSEAAADLDLSIVNTNDFSVTLSKLDYALQLGGRKIGSATVPSGASFAKGQEQVLSLPLAFKPSDLGMAAFNMLTGASADYRLKGDLNLDTPFGPIALPYDSSGKAPLTK